MSLWLMCLLLLSLVSLSGAASLNHIKMNAQSMSAHPIPSFIRNNRRTCTARNAVNRCYLEEKKGLRPESWPCECVSSEKCCYDHTYSSTGNLINPVEKIYYCMSQEECTRGIAPSPTL